MYMYMYVQDHSCSLVMCTVYSENRTEAIPTYTHSITVSHTHSITVSHMHSITVSHIHTYNTYGIFAGTRTGTRDVVGWSGD